MKQKAYLKHVAVVLAAAIAGTWSACSEDVISVSRQGSGNEIRFRALGDRPATKAGITTTDGIKNFTLSGFWTNQQATDGQKRVFDAVIVTRTESGSWEYNPKKGWPEEDMVRFFAYSPAGSPNVIKGFKGGNREDIQIRYTVPVDANAQEDLLVAVTDEMNGGDVTLNFKHALSRVMFRAKSAVKDAGVRIHGIRLMNLRPTGIWQLREDIPKDRNSFAPAPGNDVGTGVPVTPDGFRYAHYTDYMDAQMPENGVPVYLVPSDELGTDRFWKVEGENTSYEAEITQSVVVGDSEYTPVTGHMQGLMVMPQQTVQTGSGTVNPDEFYVEVSYSIGGGAVNIKKARVYDWWKKSSGSFCFEPGRQYTFDISVGTNDDIVVVGNPNVSGWEQLPVPKKWRRSDETPDGEIVASVNQDGEIMTVYKNVNIEYNPAENAGLQSLLSDLRDYLNANGKEAFRDNHASLLDNRYKDRELELINRNINASEPGAKAVTWEDLIAEPSCAKYARSVGGVIWSRERIDIIRVDSEGDYAISTIAACWMTDVGSGMQNICDGTWTLRVNDANTALDMLATAIFPSTFITEAPYKKKDSSMTTRHPV